MIGRLRREKRFLDRHQVGQGSLWPVLQRG